MEEVEVEVEVKYVWACVCVCVFVCVWVCVCVCMCLSVSVKTTSDPGRQNFSFLDEHLWYSRFPSVLQVLILSVINYFLDPPQDASY